MGRQRLASKSAREGSRTLPPDEEAARLLELRKQVNDLSLIVASQTEMLRVLATRIQELERMAKTGQRERRIRRDELMYLLAILTVTITALK